MKFSLDYNPAPSAEKFGYNNRAMLIGSCFAENIGDMLVKHRFETLVNPAGILFNPLSIADTIMRGLKGTELAEHFFVEREGKFLSYAHHSSVAANSKEELKKVIRWLDRSTSEFLKQGDFLFITLGSAFAYVLSEHSVPVANCHKQPSAFFRKELLPLSAVVEALAETISQIQEINSGLQVVISVSPVKYLRDGLVNNNRSKAILLLAAHELAEKFSNVQYFPAYELVTDDLRDYRFFKEDLAHPNSQAVNYVWEKFASTFFSEKTQEIVKEVHKLNLLMEHRLLHNDAAARAKHLAIITQLQDKITQLEPHIRF